MNFVYILKSLGRERFYIGSSSDPQRRLTEHNKGSTPSTKPYRPWELMHIESYREKSEATKREWHLKHPSGYLEKRRIIEQYKNSSVSL